MRSSLHRIERAKPLLGTFVSVRVHGLAPEKAHKAIDAAFGEISTIHALMSFHEADSDVSLLNREAHHRPVQVDERTYAVLERSASISEVSEGHFDIAIAPRLVEAGHLPKPLHSLEPDDRASWRDIVLLPGFQVRFRRPLWIDLGGIAKGFAVDCAAQRLASFAPELTCINAGGDLRLDGPLAERVRLVQEAPDRDSVPVMEIENASLASSGSYPGKHKFTGPHFDPRRKRWSPARRFASVVAPNCIDADALTKIVLIRGRRAAPVLRRFGARAVVRNTRGLWQEVA